MFLALGVQGVVDMVVCLVLGVEPLLGVAIYPSADRQQYGVTRAAIPTNNFTETGQGVRALPGRFNTRLLGGQLPDSCHQSIVD